MTDAGRQLENYRRILEISKQLNSTLEYRALLQQIVAAVVEVLKVEAATIMLLDPATGELRFEIASNLRPQETEKILVPMEGSIAGWIVTHGEPRVIEDVSKELTTSDKSIRKLISRRGTYLAYHSRHTPR